MLLTNLPIKEYQLIGQYYLGWCEYYNGTNETRIFENVLENSTAYRPNALMSLAAIEARKGNHTLEGYYFTEAIKYATSITTVIKASKGIAIVKAKEGFHKSAIKDLENLMPMIRQVEPVVYFNFLNSYAVELCEVGRIEEAQNICRIVLASPFAFAYPEWRETGQEIALRGYKSRSVISFKQQKPDNPKPENVFRLPEPKLTDTPMKSESGPAPVLSYMEWVEKMVKEPNGDDEKIKNVDKMSEQDMVLELIGMLTGGEADEEQIRKLFKAALKIFSEK